MVPGQKKSFSLSVKPAQEAIDMTLDEIKDVLERANDDVDRVSPQEYREVLNAAYTLLIKAHKSIDTMQHNEWRSSFSRGWDR